MTLVVIVVLTVFTASFVTVTPFLDFVCCLASSFMSSPYLYPQTHALLKFLLIDYIQRHVTINPLIHIRSPHFY